MQKIKFVAIVSTLLTLSACQIIIASDDNNGRGSGNTRTESRSVSNFQQISSDLPAEIKIAQGDREFLSITAQENILPKIETRVVNGQLELTLKDNENIQTTQLIQVDLQVKTIDRMNFSGAAMVKAPKINADRLSINSSGANSIEIDSLQAKQLDLDLSGTGKVRLAGQADTQAVSLSGVGKYTASKLKTQSAEIELSGTGSATVWVEKTLNVDLGGMGRVGYYGNPKLTEDVSGMGQIENLGKSPS
ncbi:MAG: head GIN domain-containing protein [Xenococcaceae cyanobacterium]